MLLTLNVSFMPNILLWHMLVERTKRVQGSKMMQMIFKMYVSYFIKDSFDRFHRVQKLIFCYRMSGLSISGGAF